jgi:hypothetical protein
VAQDKKHPHDGFVVFGDGKTEGSGPGAPGDEVIVAETLHRGSASGPAAGSAKGTFKVNGGGRDATGDITLELTDPPATTVKAAGTLSWNPSGKFGEGTLEIKGGMSGTIKVTVVNPKRYSHQP